MVPNEDHFSSLPDKVHQHDSFEEAASKIAFGRRLATFKNLPALMGNALPDQLTRFIVFATGLTRG